MSLIFAVKFVVPMYICTMDTLEFYRFRWLLLLHSLLIILTFVYLQLTKNAGFFSEFIILCFTLWALIHWMIDALFTQKLHTPNHFTVYCILFAFRMDAESKCVCVCVSTICWARILRDKPKVRGVWKEQWFGLYVSKHHIIPCTVNIWNAKDHGMAHIFSVGIVVTICAMNVLWFQI